MSVTVIILVVSLVCIVLGLLLSSSGASAGLTNISGQDLEIFKKNKDRGFIKIIQVILFIALIVLSVLIIVFSIIKI